MGHARRRLVGVSFVWMIRQPAHLDLSSHNKFGGHLVATAWKSNFTLSTSFPGGHRTMSNTTSSSMACSLTSSAPRSGKAANPGTVHRRRMASASTEGP